MAKGNILNFIGLTLLKLEHKFHIKHRPQHQVSEEEQKKLDEEARQEAAFVKQQNKAVKIFSRQKKEFKKYLRDEYNTIAQGLKLSGLDGAEIKKQLKEVRKNQKKYYRKWLDVQDLGITAYAEIYTMEETRRDYAKWSKEVNPQFDVDKYNPLKLKEYDMVRVASEKQNQI